MNQLGLRTHKAGEPGFEPEPRGPEPRVLPLDYSPKWVPLRSTPLSPVTEFLTDLLTKAKPILGQNQCRIQTDFAPTPGATAPGIPSLGTSKTGQEIQSLPSSSQLPQ